MDTVFRGIAVYLFLMILFRIAGRRALSEMTNFDFVVLLIISEATQAALVGEDFSITTCFLAVSTLIGMGLFMNFVKSRSLRLDQWLEGTPFILVADGKPLQDRLKLTRIDEEDILQEARINGGVCSMSDIKFAILEPNGKISIIPMEK